MNTSSQNNLRHVSVVVAVLITLNTPIGCWANAENPSATSGSPSLSTSTNSLKPSNTTVTIREQGADYFPTNEVLRLIEWKQRVEEETGAKDILFTNWSGQILRIIKQSETSYVIDVELIRVMANRETRHMAVDGMRIVERWVVDRDKGVRFENRLQKTGGDKGIIQP